METVHDKTSPLPVRFTTEELGRIDRLVEAMGFKSRSHLIRDAVNHYIAEHVEMKVIELRNISLAEAKKEIQRYLKGKKEAETFDIANNLRLDLETTVQALKQLWEEGAVE